jgi:hypothetical protein
MLNNCQVNQCSARPFMGHEEIVVPMLVNGSDDGQSHWDGEFWRCLRETFRPNDLSNTTVVGYTSGFHSARLDLKRVFVCWSKVNWNKVPELCAALDALGTCYAFFMESSTAPLHDGYLRRCRFVAPHQLRNFCPKLDVPSETEQVAAARDVLSAFLLHREPDYRNTYGDYFCSPDRIELFGDDENFFDDCVFWLEKEGVIRAWTRIKYSPK